MGENMVSDVSVQVLSERVSAVLDDIKEMKGKVDAMHVVNSRLAGVERDVVSVDRKAEVALSKTDNISKAIEDLRRDELEPLKINASAARKSWRLWGSVSTAGFAVLGVVYSQWHPWMDDIQRAKAARDESLSHYQADVGAEMRKTDNRLTVLEFRANNVDSKGSK
jgi:hypothetical protein